MSERDREFWRLLAKDVLQTIRVPTDAMRQCGVNGGWSGVIDGDAPCERDAAENLYQSMIDAALANA